MRVSNKKVRAAYHEAGHLVTWYLLTGNIDRIESADILKYHTPKGGGLRMRTKSPIEAKSLLKARL